MAIEETRALDPKITDIKSIKPFHAHVTIEPLERGFGHTLGNALRRVMISSLPGYAATEVKIEGVLHEYDRVEGMREDVVWLLLKLKNVVFKIIDGDSAVVKISKEGPCTVTAGDIEVPHNVEIINKDHVLATLTKKGKLNMEITVEKGVGYQSVAMREGEGGSKRFGVICLDALYSPVRRSAFQVESARVANRIDLDRLVMDIETNGTMDFEEVIQSASLIMIEQLSVFAKIDRQRIGLELSSASAAEAAASNHPLLSEEISAMGLSARSQNCLHTENVRYVGDLVRKTEKDLMKTPHLGRKSLIEIKLFLDKSNLRLGMELPDWTPPPR